MARRPPRNPKRTQGGQHHQLPGLGLPILEGQQEGNENFGDDQGAGEIIPAALDVTAQKQGRRNQQENGPGKKRVEEYCRILYAFIVKSQVWQKLKLQEEQFKKLGEKALEKEYSQIYGIVIDLLDKMVEILGEEMNKRGVKTHAGAKFQPNSINRILKNKIYLGIFERGGKQSPVNESMKIISDKEFEEAQRIMAQRTKEMARKSSIAYTTRGKALLGGNIFCKHCGSKMYGISYTDTYTTAKGEKRVYKGVKYCCPNRARKRGECDGMTQYLADRVDEAVLFAVNQTLEKIKGSAKDEAIKTQYENIVKEKKSVYLSLKQKMEK